MEKLCCCVRLSMSVYVLDCLCPMSVSVCAIVPEIRISTNAKCLMLNGLMLNA